MGDIDLIEVNEAFAAVVLRFMQAFQVDPAKVNVNGGAIAMGHPLGAPGAIIYFVDVQFSVGDDCDEGRLPWDHFGAEVWEVERG